MSFLHASLLFGGFFIAVPIAIHLIMRRQPKLVIFPALQFIRQKQEANRRSLRLRHLVLLALRCAAIGLLALALARPSLTGSGVLGKEGAPIAAALVVDNGLRMEYRKKNVTRLEAAIQLADRFLAQLPDDTSVVVGDLAGGRPTFAVDLGSARQQVAQITPSAATRPLIDAVGDAIRSLQQKADHRKELFVFTDLAKAAWPDQGLKQISEQLDAAGDVAMYIVDVGIEDAVNFGLGHISIADPVIVPEKPVSLRVATIRSGPSAECPVEFVLHRPDAEPERRDHRMVQWSSDTMGEVEFSLTGLEYGTHQCVIRILGNDGLPADDSRYFTIRVQSPRRILLLGESKRNATFVETALVTSGRYQCRFETFGGAANIEFDPYEAVFLLDPPPLPDAIWQGLYRFVKGGGGTIICLGHNARRDPLNANDPQQLLAGPLKRQSRASTYLSPSNYNHPILIQLRPYAGQIPWRQFPIDKSWDLDGLNRGAISIVGYADGRPALIERMIGTGRALTLTTPLSDPPYVPEREVWNYLPIGLATEPWPFPPFIRGLAGHLAGGGEERANYLAGEIATLHLGPEERREVQTTGGFVVLLPTGEGFRRSLAPGDNTVTLSTTQNIGNYRVTAGGKAGSLKRGFSVNADPVISRLARTTTNHIATALGAKRVRFARNADEIEISVGLGRVGKELYPWIIGLVALSVAGELLLSNRFYREQQ
ncbi:MAG: BatA domain-containing protein [Pirellulales bacterium]|nr:BatA domain-containing protein [Pirellulales bacterium]